MAQNALVQKQLDTLQAQDRDLAYASFQYLIEQTKHEVDWAYQVWDGLLEMLKSKDNHKRAIAAQLLNGLAKSDPEGRMLKDVDRIFETTKDEKFVTARHSLQSLWKAGIANEDLGKKVVDGLVKRFRECINEKNCTLIRYDIQEVLKKIYDHTGDTALMQKSLALIETEEDLKYRKKYSGLWKKV